MHVGQLISQHPVQLLKFNSYMNEMLKAICTPEEHFEVVQYYKENTPQLKKDIKYILALVKNYYPVYSRTWNANPIDVFISLILPHCTTKQLLKCRDLFLKEKGVLPSMFVDKKVPLTSKQLENLLDNSGAFQYFPWIEVQDLALFSDVKIAISYIYHVCKRNNVGANPERVLTALQAMDQANTPVNNLRKLHVLHKLFTMQQYEPGIQWAKEAYVRLNVAGLQETTILTQSQACRNAVMEVLTAKVDSQLVPLDFSLDMQGMTKAAKDRLKLFMCQLATSDTLDKNELSLRLLEVWELNVEDYLKLSTSLNDFHDADPFSEENCKKSLYDYLIEKYFEVVHQALGWNLDYFKEQFSTVYSLVPFMSPSVKIATWMSKELNVDNAELILFLQNHGSTLYQHSKYSETYSTTELISVNGKKVKSLTVSAAYFISSMYVLLTAQTLTGSKIAFTSIKLKEFAETLYKTCSIGRTKKTNALYVDIDYDYFKADPLLLRHYVGLYESGMTSGQITEFRESMSDYLCSRADELIKVIRATKHKTQVLSWAKLISDASSSVISSKWISDMQEVLQLKAAPKSMEQLIDMFAEQCTNKDKTLVRALLKNEYHMDDPDEDLPRIESLLEDLEDIEVYKAKTHSNLPTVHFSINDQYEAFILPPGDKRALIIGTLTGCCQHIKGAASSIAITSYTDPDQGVFVVASKTGKIVAQSFIWHGKINKPEKVAKHFKTENFNGKLLAIDSIECHIFGSQITPIDQAIAKGYYMFMQEMTKHGYVVGINPDENEQARKVIRTINQQQNTTTNSYLRRLTNATSDYKRKLGYSDLVMSDCYGYIVNQN